MNSKLLLPLFILLMGHLSLAQGVLRRNVTIELEEVEAAKAYEVELTEMADEKVLKTKIFKVNGPLWKGFAPLGDYRLRSRSLDERGVPGDWSEAIEFQVNLPAPLILQPASGSSRTPASQEGDKSQVPFLWTAVSSAHRYILSVQSLDGEFSETFETDQTQYSVELEPDRLYRWSVQGVRKNGSKGESSGISLFSLDKRMLAAPEIKPPSFRETGNIEWTKPENATGYSYVLSIKLKNGQWKEVEKRLNIPDNYVNFDGRRSGIYGLSVRAEGEGYSPSAEARREVRFSAKSRDPAALQAAEISRKLEHKQPWFFVASYMLTSMDYQGGNYETNQQGQFNAVGGTGRLGFGYFAPEKPLGIMALADLSGFAIDEKNYTFASVELHAVHRSYPWKGLLRLSGGPFLKELPEVYRRPGSNTEVGTIRGMGPHLGAEFWRPLTEKLGVMTHFRTYASVFGSAPNGRNIVASLSAQLGVLGSYRLGSQTLGFMGYTYRTDTLKYNAAPSWSNPSSQAQDGDINYVEVRGHYVNLILETSF